LHRELDLPCAPDRNRLRIDPQHLAISEILLKKLRQRWHTWLSHSEKPDTTSSELIFRLQVVAAVRPQTGIANRYQHVAHRPGESADPWTPLPALRNVFTLVWIGTGNKERVDANLAHLCAERLNSMFHCLHHSSPQSSLTRADTLALRPGRIS
jgi:hypothetical protein